MITDTTTATPAAVPAPASPPPTPTIQPGEFSAAEARTDRWRQLTSVIRAWHGASAHPEREDALFGEAFTLFGEMVALESLFAYPGSRLVAAIEHALAERNTGVCSS